MTALTCFDREKRRFRANSENSKKARALQEQSGQGGEEPKGLDHHDQSNKANEVSRNHFSGAALRAPERQAADSRSKKVNS